MSMYGSNLDSENVLIVLEVNSGAGTVRINKSIIRFF